MILQDIANKTKLRIDEKKKRLPLSELKSQVADMDTETDFPFEKALRQQEISFICEVKKASPSKGVISPNFPYLQIAKEYEAAGANALSVLTEPDYFLGSIDILKEIKKEVRIPVLRKDFIIDPYMIYEAKAAGADAVLLICALLNDDELLEYRCLAECLGMSALVEAHDEKEIQQALTAESRIIGVNNRNLKTFTVDIQNSLRLRSLVPDSVLFVSESGIRTPQDISALRENQTHGVLIGETLMRSQSKSQALAFLNGEGL